MDYWKATLSQMRVIYPQWRFKKVVAQDMEQRFNVSEPVKEKNIAFCHHLDPHYHQLKFMDYSIRTTTYSMLKEKLALLSCEEEYQIV